MTLGEFREQTKGMSDDLELEFYSERYNDSTQPKYLEFEPEGYIEFIIDDDRWDLVGKESTFIIPDNATNGDMIKAMFPTAKTWEVTRDDVHCAYIEFKDICEIKSFPLSWWNAPYKKEVG